MPLFERYRDLKEATVRSPLKGQFGVLIRGLLILGLLTLLLWRILPRIEWASDDDESGEGQIMFIEIDGEPTEEQIRELTGQGEE